jgi:hypothetical protein
MREKVTLPVCANAEMANAISRRVRINFFIIVLVLFCYFRLGFSKKPHKGSEYNSLYSTKAG